MDKMLERILSLLPRTEDGKIVHGAKKEFAESIGLSHNLVTMWEKGQSKSYRNYVQQISEKYKVSVDWLVGNTDIKEKSAAPGGTTLHDTDYDKLSDANRAIIDDLIAKLYKAQSDD